MLGWNPRLELIQRPKLGLVKVSGFSSNPYSSQFLFISIYSSHFSFMQAFATRQSLLSQECDSVTSALFQRLRYESVHVSLSHIVANYFLSLSISLLFNRLWAPAATGCSNDHEDLKPCWTLAGMYESTHHFQPLLGNYLSPTTKSTTAIQCSPLRLEFCWNKC